MPWGRWPCASVPDYRTKRCSKRNTLLFEVMEHVVKGCARRSHHVFSPGQCGSHAVRRLNSWCCFRSLQPGAMSVARAADRHTPLSRSSELRRSAPSVLSAGICGTRSESAEVLDWLDTAISPRRGGVTAHSNGVQGGWRCEAHRCRGKYLAMMAFIRLRPTRFAL